MAENSFHSCVSNHHPATCFNNQSPARSRFLLCDNKRKHIVITRCQRKVLQLTVTGFQFQNQIRKLAAEQVILYHASLKTKVEAIIFA
jgi:hypothetical protein